VVGIELIDGFSQSHFRPTLAKLPQTSFE